MANNNAALYMRLSRDDESYGDSVSIETQYVTYSDCNVYSIGETES